MRNKFQLLFILLTIIFFSFPSICFSELKTVEGDYCGIYMGDMKDKKELGKFRKSVRGSSLRNGVEKLDIKHNPFDFFVVDLSQYLEKIVVVSHTERGRKICEKVKVTVDPEVIKALLNKIGKPEKYWYDDIDDVLTKKSYKINIGLIIETKIPYLDIYKREIMENEEEKWFHYMIEVNSDKYKVVDRRHLTKILEEQKLSSSGITDSETVKLGKILNLDIIVLRMIYEESKITKVLKVDTGEVLLFRTYLNEVMKTDSEQSKFSDPPDKRWIYFMTGENKSRHYYDSQTVTYPSKNIIRVWSKIQFAEEMEKNKGTNLYKEMDIYYEINCRQQEYRIIDSRGWFWDGRADSSDEPTQWSNINPESANEHLSKKLCNNLKIKKNIKSEKKK